MAGNDTAPSGHQRRRSIVDMLNPRPTSNTNLSTSPSAAVPTGPNVPQRRSMSIALGLAGSADNPNSPYNAFARQRRASISTSNGSPEFKNSFDENAILEEDDQTRSMNTPPSPSFARRLSFGAQALRDVRGSTSPSNNAGRQPPSALSTLDENGGGNGNGPPQAKLRRSSGAVRTTGEGFNWTDAMRDRTRRPSISSGNPFSNMQGRSTAVNAPISPVEPPKEMPRSSPMPVPVANTKLKKPDHLGERMLRGEFMMD